MSHKETRLVAQNKNGDAIAFSQSHFPPSEVLDSFEKYQPGAAAIILEMSRSEQTHTHYIEKADCKCETTCRIVGMLSGFILCFALLGGGIFLIYVGKGWGGYPSVVTAFFMLIANIANQKNQKKQQGQ